jgi:type IV pilus assembly protein PilE
MKAKARGFTLIELVVVVAIVAILAAIALPSYRNFILRTHRADAKELAMRIAATEERNFTNQNNYTTLAALGMSNVSENKYYTAAVVLANANQTYTITLTPAGMQVGDKCGNLTINNTGAKAFTGDESNGKCW